MYVRDCVDMILSRKVDQSSRFIYLFIFFFLRRSRMGVGVDTRRKIMHIFELFDLFHACCYKHV